MQTDAQIRDPKRLSAAIRLVLARYLAQLRRWPWLAAGALVLPAVAEVMNFYAPPLVIARLLGRFAREEALTAADLAPYVATFAALWLGSQVFWRIAVACLARIEINGLKALYVEAMDELLAKDLAFFQNNYAGSLTKRALGYARRFEDVFDVMAFQLAPSLLPLFFVSAVLGSYSIWLVVGLLAMLTATLLMVIPLIRPGAHSSTSANMHPTCWRDIWPTRSATPRLSGPSPAKTTRHGFMPTTSPTSAARHYGHGTTRISASTW